MNSRNFRTRQEFKHLNNPKGKDYIIGLDVGYSSTKVFYENGYFVFPSFAKKVYGMLELPNDKDILYKEDSSKDVYMVGYMAQDMVESTDTNDTDGELFSRKRYGTKVFKILCNVALAIATLNKEDNRKIVVQTGLPTSYVEADEPSIKKAITKPDSFSIKVGKGKWKHFDLSIDKNNIYVMPQPSGSLYSVLIQNDGNYVSNAFNILNQNNLVLDIGFGTFDFLGIKNRSTTCKESVDNVGMRAVLTETSKKILKEYEEEIRVSAIQHNLETGKVVCINEDDMKDEEKSINPLLSAANKEVFTRAMEKAKGVTNAFRGYSNIIIAGGTGEAWFNSIKAWLSQRQSLRIIPSNVNDHLPFIYSNARGYYLFRYASNKKK